MAAEIVDYLDERDVRPCLSISRTFRAAAVSRIHRHITLPAASDSPNRKDMERFTTAVELEAHDHRDCRKGRPLQFQRLRTLILHREVIEEHPGQGPAKDNYGVPLDFGQYACSEANCVSASFSLKRLVVRPWTTPAKDKRVFFVPPSTCDTIIHLDRRGPYVYRQDLTGNKAPRHITIVLLPSFYGQFKSFMSASQCETGSKSLDNDSLFRECLAPYVLDNPQNVITVVGLEDANPFASTLHWSERAERASEEETALRGYLNRLMRGVTRMADGERQPVWDEIDRKRRQNTIHIRTTREYFEKGSWGEELSWRTVGPWLNAYHEREKEDARLEATRSTEIVSTRCRSISQPDRSTSPTTRSIMAEIASKTRHFMPSPRISVA